jgi:hypothetical protein
VPDHEIEYDSTRGKGISLTLRIDPEVASDWRTAAQRNGLTLLEWISLSLTLADKLCLVDGYEKTPSIGRRIDPLLARAIMEAAQGQEWEHRAMLLLGMANPLPDDMGPLQKRKNGRVPTQLVDLFTRYGIPFAEVAPNYFAVIGDNVLTWQELAYVLTIWDESQFDWCYLSNKGLEERTKMNKRDAQKATERAVTQGLVEREPLPHEVRARRTRNRTRIARSVGEAILRGDIRPATVDDSYSESYLTVQSKVDPRNAGGEYVDPRMLQAARDAQQQGRTSATETIKGYLAALDQSTT